jgi:hypothetical protein
MTMLLDFVEKNFDEYTRKARLAPALFVTLPIFLAAISFFPDQISLTIIPSLLVCFGVMRFLSQIARDRGKAIEADLYESWGGTPTTNLLRHRSNQNKLELDVIHNKLHELTGQKIPSIDEENAAPDIADQTYEVCIKSLIAKTRDRNQFSLLFEENCTYGFRRNLLGLKIAGIIISALSMILVSIKFAYTIGFFNAPKVPQENTWLQSLVGQKVEKYQSNFLQDLGNLNYTDVPPLVYVSLFIDVFFLLGFWYINKSWVKIAADAYAVRLIESCKILK